MGTYPTAYAINLLYPQVTNPPEASYWFNPGSENISIGRHSAQASRLLLINILQLSMPIFRMLWRILFNTEQDECLHVLRPDYSVVADLSAEAYRWAAVSNLSRIEPTTKSVPPPDIFGNEPEHTWCYYYEKADLASQFQDWHQIISLWQEADQQGVWARNGVELLPFIQGYAMFNDWQTARKITIQASVLPDQQWPLLCALWKISILSRQPLPGVIKPSR